ncbi:hypothetical protein DPMN_194521 [Dreissena polymorpha]|uniref:Uncharacterized protein n=1 Tax=Dreissena polymorpha TaxID=45954 RepID=A0A9D4BGJ5_DREPO|nr:hypothetical protein DPMN_194521 [Dreissena polymorpha]
MALRKEVNILEEGSKSFLSDENENMSTASFYTETFPKNRRLQKGENPTTEFNGRRKNKCAFCDESHKSVECMKFQDTSSRLQKKCFKGHIVAKCMSQKRCLLCKRKHDTSICNTSGSDDLTLRRTPEASTLRPGAAIFHSSLKPAHSGVLLKTAIAVVGTK